MRLDAVLDALVRGDHEHAVAGVQRLAHRLGVAVVGLHDLGTRELRRAGRVADEQALLDAGGGEPLGDVAADLAGGAGDDDAGGHGRSLSAHARVAASTAA